MSDRYDDLSEYAWLMDQVILHELPQALALGPLLINTFHPKSVIDVGAGPGIYLIPFIARGIEILGIDGCPPPEGGKSLAPSEFQVVDLRIPWTPAHEYDLALSIEVAEHIHADHARTLVETLSRCAPIIFFTAAPPGQGGENHVNEQPPEYWMGLFSEVGYDRDADTTAALRTAMAQDEAYAHCGWLRSNSMIFRRRP